MLGCRRLLSKCLQIKRNHTLEYKLTRHYERNKSVTKITLLRAKKMSGTYIKIGKCHVMLDASRI